MYVAWCVCAHMCIYNPLLHLERPSTVNFFQISVLKLEGLREDKADFLLPMYFIDPHSAIFPAPLKRTIHHFPGQVNDIYIDIQYMMEISYNLLKILTISLLVHPATFSR